MSVRRTRSVLYRLARGLGDYQALASGSPRRIVKRAANKVIGRKVGRRMWFR